MRGVLQDIRLLKLAELYERAYEAFVIEMAERVVDDDAARAALMKLVDPADQHGERIAAELERLNASIPPAEHMDVLRAALMDVCDTERAARRFYAEHADKVHDPRVARLFQQLAVEEGRHERIANEALRALERRVGTGTSRVRLEDLRLADEVAEALPGEAPGSRLLEGSRLDADRPARRR